MFDPEGDGSGLGPFQWGTFLDTPPEQARYEDAGFVVLSAPFDSTTSFKTGARDGPAAIIAASAHLEDYDLELDRDVSEFGIHTMPELVPDLSSMEAMIQQVDRLTDRVVSDGKTPVILGGEHTVTIGAVSAVVRRYPDLSVLYLDAHGDLRDEYMGTRWGHASVARRLLERCPVVHAGVRSLSAEERTLVTDQNLPAHFWPTDIPLDDYATSLVGALSPVVYLSIDLDVLDPSIMAAVGTPEPDGMLWADLIAILRVVCRERRVVGFDIVELSPPEGPEACAFAAAKLAYKLMGYVSALCPN